MTCTFTKAYLLETIRALLNEKSSVEWTDDQLNKWIQEAAIDISTKTLGDERVSKFVTIANQLEYDDPTKCIKIHSIVKGGDGLDCETAPTIAYSDSSDDTINRDDEATVIVTGGVGPFTWSVTGTGFWFDEAHTLTEIETDARTTTLYADDTAEGTANIAVTDTCDESDDCGGGGGGGGTTTNGSIDCTCPPDVVIAYSDSSDDTIDREGTATIIVTGGVGPFTWSVTGTGFTIPASTDGRANILSADDTACGSATITVTDQCGDSCTGYVRGTEGQWVLKSNTCVFTGLYDSASSGRWYTKTVGNKRQGQRIFDSTWGYEWDPYTCEETGDAVCAGHCGDYGYDGTMCLTLGGLVCPPGVWNFPPCECHEYECVNGFFCYYTRDLAYYEWEC